MNPDLLSIDGYVLVPDVLSAETCAMLTARIESHSASGGTRALLQYAWCADLAGSLREHPALAGLIPAAHAAVQCSYFEKSAARNWLVPIHQDLSIPVADRVSEPSLRGWSEKESSLFVQAPVEVLESLVALRLHLDDCTEADGPLRVLPGSHQRGVITPESAALARRSGTERSCVIEQGGALVLHPLLLHASSKSSGLGRRRVLHFLFGPPALPLGLRWRHAV